MWLKIMDWIRESNHVQIMIIAIPMIWFTVRYYFSRFRKAEEVEEIEEQDQHHDWIGKLEVQLRKFEQHSRKIGEMGLEVEYIREDTDAKNKMRKSK